MTDDFIVSDPQRTSKLLDEKVLLVDDVLLAARRIAFEEAAKLCDEYSKKHHDLNMKLQGATGAENYYLAHEELGRCNAGVGLARKIRELK